MKKIFFLLILNFCLTACLPAFVEHSYVLHKSSSLLKEEKVAEASELLQSHIVQFPDDILALYNLAVVYVIRGQNEKAEKMFLYIEKNFKQNELQLSTEENNSLEFFVYFNLANLYAADKKNKAIEYYSKALNVFPESMEAKVNIELLMNASGGGSGKNQQKEQQEKKEDNKDEQQQDEQKQQEQNKNYEKENKPKAYEGKELSEQDVKALLDELKRQEQNIRAKQYDKQKKQQKNEKDW